MVRTQTRSRFQTIHLCLGLSLGGIFLLLGLTGSAIAWRHELDRMLNPDLFESKATATPGLTVHSSAALTPAQAQAAIDRLKDDPRYGQPAQLILPQQADEVFVAWYPLAPSSEASLLTTPVSRQVMLNPHTLQVNGERNWGELGLSRRLLMPTLFHLHRYLAAGEPGKTLIGLCGLGLLIMVLSGLVLWCPKLQRKALLQALSIAYRGSWPRLNYSAHRAAGFFAAPVFLVLGFSGWYFNLPKWVTPLVSSVATVSASDKPVNLAPHGGTRVSPHQVLDAAQALYPHARLSRIVLPTKVSMPYEIRLRQPGELRQGDGATRIAIDAWSGAILQVRDPLRAPAGDRFLNTLFPLHSGEAFGLAGRMFISGFGVLPLLFLATGLGIYRKRRKKH